MVATSTLLPLCLVLLGSGAFAAHVGHHTNDGDKRPMYGSSFSEAGNNADLLDPMPDELMPEDSMMRAQQDLPTDSSVDLVPVGAASPEEQLMANSEEGTMGPLGATASMRAEQGLADEWRGGFVDTWMSGNGFGRGRRGNGLGGNGNMGGGYANNGNGYGGSFNNAGNSGGNGNMGGYANNGNGNNGNNANNGDNGNNGNGNNGNNGNGYEGSFNNGGNSGFNGGGNSGNRGFNGNRGNGHSGFGRVPGVPGVP